MAARSDRMAPAPMGRPPRVEAASDETRIRGRSEAGRGTPARRDPLARTPQSPSQAAPHRPSPMTPRCMPHAQARRRSNPWPRSLVQRVPLSVRPCAEGAPRTLHLVATFRFSATGSRRSPTRRSPTSRTSSTLRVDTAAVRRHCREAAGAADGRGDGAPRDATRDADEGHRPPRARAVETVTIEKLRHRGWVCRGPSHAAPPPGADPSDGLRSRQQRRISAGDRASFAA